MAKTREVRIHGIFANEALSREAFYIKTPLGYQKFDAGIRAFPKKSYLYRGEDDFELYRKQASGNFELCASVKLPEKARELCLVVYEAEKLGVGAFEYTKPSRADSQLILVNLGDVSLRGIAKQGTPMKLDIGEAKAIFTLPKGVEKISVDFKILAAAKTKEDAKRAWRFASALSVHKGQRYFLVVIPAIQKDASRPKRYEVFSLREAL